MMRDNLTAPQQAYIDELTHIARRLFDLGVQSISISEANKGLYTFAYLNADPVGLLAEERLIPLDEEAGSYIKTVSLSEDRIVLTQCLPSEEVAIDVDP